MHGVVWCGLAERAEMALQSCDRDAGGLYRHGCICAGGVAREFGARSHRKWEDVVLDVSTEGEHNMRRGSRKRRKRVGRFYDRRRIAAVVSTRFKRCSTGLDGGTVSGMLAETRSCRSMWRWLRYEKGRILTILDYSIVGTPVHYLGTGGGLSLVPHLLMPPSH